MILPHFFKSQWAICVVTAMVAQMFVAEASLASRRIVVIDKARQEAVVFLDDRAVARFPASFGIDPRSDKRKAFDCATPEGLYAVTYKNDRSRFHRTLGLSYPSPANAEKALADGAISLAGYTRIRDAARKSRSAPCNTGLGCGIAIHGGGVYRYFGVNRERDWTEGCVALDNKDMDWLFHFCRAGDPVLIFHSGKNLYGIIRPFTRSTRLDPKGVPVCPGEVCTYAAELWTSLGRVRVTITEGKNHGRSMDVMVYNGKGGAEPVLALADRNADSHISVLDSLSGPMADAGSPDDVYGMVKEAVSSALSGGAIPAPGNNGP